MVSLLGGNRRLCDGITRRELLTIGGIGSLTLADVLAAEASQPGRKGGTFGRAKSCILLFPYGSPPQHETFDPKPDVSEIQGELKAISTKLDGLQICEMLPRIAEVADRMTVVRSMTHPYPLHGVAYAVTGIPEYTPALEAAPRDQRHWPFIGSVVDYLDERRTGITIPPVPRNVGLPWLLNSQTDQDVSAGPYAAFLGPAYDPFWTNYDGKGVRKVPRYYEHQPTFEDPWGGCTADGRFTVTPMREKGAEVSLDRLGLRRSLLSQFDTVRSRLDDGETSRVYGTFQERAFSLLTSARTREALDLGRESPALREKYGMTLFGQSCLVARRLVEAGSRFISVFWDGYGQFAGCAWDTHSNHYPRLKEVLLPGFDRAYSALIRDLEDRGLLDDTLVLWMSEHGRTPQIDTKPPGAARHHWSQAYSMALAGGGSARGRVVGKTDRIGGTVEETPVSPKDILATTYHLLGIDPETTVPDRFNRPMPIAGDGRLRPELLG